MIYSTETELKKALPSLIEKKVILYCLRKGSDTGGSVLGAIKDGAVAYTTDKNEAVELYRNLIALQGATALQPLNKRIRFFCSLKALDLSLPVYAHLPNSKRLTRIGFKSNLLYYHNFTESPNMHKYMTNVRNGISENFHTILKSEAYRYAPSLSKTIFVY